MMAPQSRPLSGMDAELRLQYEVERFYARESHLLDERKFEEWLDLFTDDYTFRVPIAQNVAFNVLDEEYLEGRLDVSWIDEGKDTIEKRIAQIRTGVHWAEEPLSRTVHLVGNVLIDVAESAAEGPVELNVKASVLSYRHRLADQENTTVGRRHDRLRRVEGGWRVSRRTLYISQTVFLGSSLSHFI